MPRLPPSLIWRARSISPHAATLLPVCRDIPSALTELRWIREHVESTPSPTHPASIRLDQLCKRRGKGIPLQYVLGTQPFGSLELQCRPGVLIPRPEPEAYSTHLGHLLLANPSLIPLPPSKTLRILDFCTGTGCIALLLYSHLSSPSSPLQRLNITGVDISPLAISLSKLNLTHNISLGALAASTQDKSISFIQSSIFSPDWMSEAQDAKCDILISNPPYISPRGFNTDVARSVRNYEPKLAQVPEPQHTHHPYSQKEGVRQEDIFYARLLDIGAVQRPTVMLFETGGMDQAKRVVEMAAEKLGVDEWKMEIWRDWPDGRPEEEEETAMRIDGLGDVKVKGSGHGRSVFIYRRK